jgi:hypothetical protein
MNQQERLEQLKSLLNSSEKAIIEIQNGTNIDFYSALIQTNSIECFNLSKQLVNLNSSPIAKESVIEVAKPIETIVPETPSTPVVKIEQPIEVVLEPVVESVIEPIQETTEPEPIKAIEIVKEEVKIEEPIVEIVEAPIFEKKIETNTKSEENAPVSKPVIAKVETPEDDTSLNAKLSKNKTPVLNFADKSTETAIADLSKAISIGKKFEFINGLFAGNSEVYKNSIQTLQNAENFEAAINYIENEITSQFDWNDSENENLAAEFFALIKRRFN